MLAAETYHGEMLRGNGLLEVHKSKISLHRASAEYSYPTVRLPHYLAESLAGLSTRIYQTVHDGALAFLVVVSSDRKAVRQSAGKSENAKISFDRLLDMAEIAGPNPAEPIVLFVIRTAAEAHCVSRLRRYGKNQGQHPQMQIQIKHKNLCLTSPTK
jgi:hypothetical protein